ncbi:tetratricopeptide repeat protein [Clostridium saccharobutylicum]|uniref:Localization factor PodJL n=1 Tax=Clostridium saccharobutylicum TaxID=169679 RepID=A0A1S8N5F5_CLOSA|nr:tetratricopeptide repeat protein [Clostridium saccharobutylicum]OOM11704.1 localization factor PodJL [Clostridium saccharobutylicum]
MDLCDLERLALEGNVELQYQLGVLYQLGEEVEKDYKKAVKYFKMAAENGYADAQCELGHMYCTGKGVEVDYKEGYKWLKLAGNQNNDIAQGNIGFMYENGYGVKQDYEEAFRYYIMSAQNGNATAQKTVANMYQKGLGVEKNIEESNKWLKILTNQKEEVNNLEQNNSQLHDKLYGEILKKCSIGDELVEESRYNEAIESYLEALELIPSPKDRWEASTWVNTALGDTYFQINKYNKAREYLYDAMNCPNGIANPFILLRLGECLYKIGNIDEAKEYLIRTYMLEGMDIFENEDKEYFKLIENLV